MMSGFKSAGVPAEALLSPTLMLTGRSASGVYAQPAAELARLTENGAAIKLARGFYAAVPVGKRADSWLPSLEATAAGIASAAYGVGKGAIWGLSAARVHGALPRALSVAYAMGSHSARHSRVDPTAGSRGVSLPRHAAVGVGVLRYRTRSGAGDLNRPDDLGSQQQ